MSASATPSLRVCDAVYAVLHAVFAPQMVNDVMTTTGASRVICPKPLMNRARSSSA